MCSKHATCSGVRSFIAQRRPTSKAVVEVVEEAAVVGAISRRSDGFVLRIALGFIRQQMHLQSQSSNGQWFPYCG